MFEATRRFWFFYKLIFCFFYCLFSEMRLQSILKRSFFSVKDLKLLFWVRRLYCIVSWGIFHINWNLLLATEFLLLSCKFIKWCNKLNFLKQTLRYRRTDNSLSIIQVDIKMTKIKIYRLLPVFWKTSWIDKFFECSK